MDAIVIEIGIRLAAEARFRVVLVAVLTNINVFEYVLDIFTPLCGVVSQTIIGSFDDLFGALLSNIKCDQVESGAGTIDGCFDGYFNDWLLVTVVEAVIHGSLYGADDISIVFGTCIPSVTSHIILF